MNIRKNAEVLFLAIAALGLVGSYATANDRPITIAASTVSTAPALDMASIQTVVVSAPRLTATL
ncbi:hypothetical protein AB2N08_16195 [Massilia aurea]|uniref:hypothetical protein n=1 Tax=Massilia aurea TaxID=373040 RepID=UPI003462F318